MPRSVAGYRQIFFLSTAVAIIVVLSPILLLAWDSRLTPDRSSQQEIKYSQDPNASKNMTPLLKDFDPKSMLHVETHDVPRAKFPVIDIHNHVNDPGGVHGEEIPPGELVQRMNHANVKKIAILTGMWGAKLQGVLDKMVTPYPDRFIVFAQYDWSKINDANFSAEMVVQLDEAVRRGARGLKVLKDLGLGVRDGAGKLLPIDDPRLDPVWEECGRLGIPVAIHSTDPEAFFTPVDNHNERYEELISNPSWSFYGPQFPSKQALLAQRNHIIEKHPRTMFMALHVANWLENLDAVSAWLDKYPICTSNLGRARRNLEGSRGGHVNSLSITRTVFFSERTASRRKRCTRTTSVGSKLAMSIFLTGVPRAGAVGDLWNGAAGWGTRKGLP